MFTMKRNTISATDRITRLHLTDWSAKGGRVKEQWHIWLRQPQTLPTAKTRLSHEHHIQLDGTKILSIRSHYKEDGLTLSTSCRPISHSLREHMMPLMVVNHASFRGCPTHSLLLPHLPCSLTVQQSNCQTNRPPSEHHYHSHWLSTHSVLLPSTVT